MSRALIIHRAGPGVTVQDMGRPGYLAFGLSRGGAADRLALYEGAALLGQPETCAALELAGTGGVFESTDDMRIALTGARMRATLEGSPMVWNASHVLPAGAKLEIGAAEHGSYGYLHVGGGIATPEQLGSRAAHLAARIGAALSKGTRLPVGPDKGTETGLTLDPLPRFDGGTVRIVPSLQTDVFPQEDITRFEAIPFRRDTRGNRMGVRLIPDGEGFGTEAGLNILSEVIVPGDVQVTGDGTPFILLSECQTTGGYPRIGSVLPADLPRVAQTRPGAELRFQFVTLDEAVEIERREAERRRALRKTIRPLVRNPHDMGDLLSYRLIDGVIAGDEGDNA